MKALAAVLIALQSISAPAYAGCDFATIQKTQGGYLYSAECHVQVGVLVESNRLLTQEVAELRQGAEKLQLAYNYLNTDRDQWRDSALKVGEKFDRYQGLSSTQNSIFLGLGVAGGIALTVLSVWAAGELAKAR